MKKLLSLLLGLALCFSTFAFVGCGEKKPEGKYTFYAPDGAPAIAIAKFINDNDDLGLDKPVEYTVVAPKNIANAMSQGTADIMIMPINAASKMYKANKDAPYKMAGVVTHGNLYIMNSLGITDVAGLVGKVVGVLPNVPELTLKAALSAKGIAYENGTSAIADKVVLNTFTGDDGAINMISALKQGTLDVGLLAEPACTNLTKKASEKTWARIDVQTLYDSQTNAFPQAVLMVKKSVLDTNPDFISTVSGKIDANVNWAKNNVATAVTAVSGKIVSGVTPSMNANNITATVIDNCKIYWQGASQSKTAVKVYIDSVIAINAQSAVAIQEDFFA